LIAGLIAAPDAGGNGRRDCLRVRKERGPQADEDCPERRTNPSNVPIEQCEFHPDFSCLIPFYCLFSAIAALQRLASKIAQKPATPVSIYRGAVSFVSNRPQITVRFLFSKYEGMTDRPIIPNRKLARCVPMAGESVAARLNARALWGYSFQACSFSRARANSESDKIVKATRWKQQIRG
jgi:hypothetical protein